MPARAHGGRGVRRPQPSNGAPGGAARRLSAPWGRSPRRAGGAAAARPAHRPQIGFTAAVRARAASARSPRRGVGADSPRRRHMRPGSPGLPRSAPEPGLDHAVAVQARHRPDLRDVAAHESADVAQVGSPTTSIAADLLRSPDASEGAGGDVRPPDLAQRVADLAHRGAGTRARPSSGTGRCPCPRPPSAARPAPSPAPAGPARPAARRAVPPAPPRSPGRRAGARSGSSSSSRKRLTPTTTRSPESVSWAIAVRRLRSISLLLEALFDRRSPPRPAPRPWPSAPRRAASTSSVIDSTTYDPANGSTVAVTSVSYASTCWVRSASRAAFSVGSAIASSKELVCSDCVPPSTAASAWTATRTRLTSGCCAVSWTPAVWVWKRSISDLGFFAPNSSRMTCAQIRRAARNFATSSSSVVRDDEEERQPRREVVDVHAGGDGGADVLDAVGEREGDLLRGRRTGLGHVVAGDGDGVPARDLGAAVARRCR